MFNIIAKVQVSCKQDTPPNIKSNHIGYWVSILLINITQLCLVPSKIFDILSKQNSMCSVKCCYENAHSFT